MNKLCCCTEPELPDISVNVTCACFESHVEQVSAKDSPDLDITKEEEETAQKAEEEEEDSICCCCFRRKRHANARKKKCQPSDGSKA